MMILGKIRRRLAAVVLMTAVSTACHGWAVITVDPILMEAVIQGSFQVNYQLNTEIDDQLEMGVLQNSIGLMFNGIKTWEKKYNSYLKTAQGYAESLKAGTTLYADAMVTLRNIYDIKRAVAANPQGLAANLVMTNIYAETVDEFLKTFRMLKIAIAQGGEYNMLTGKERTMMMWALCDRIDELNKKLNTLIMCLYYYRIEDVWNYATAGMLDRDIADIAEIAYKRWERVHQTVAIMIH